MSVIKKIGAWVGFAYDVGRIIFAREWDDEPTQSSDASTSSPSIEPVVHVTPAAKLMLAQASSPQPRPKPVLLEGSIDARLKGTDSR